MLEDAVLYTPCDYHLEAYPPIAEPIPGSGLLTFIGNDVPFVEVLLSAKIQVKKPIV